MRTLFAKWRFFFSLPKKKNTEIDICFPFPNFLDTSNYRLLRIFPPSFRAVVQVTF